MRVAGIPSCPDRDGMSDSTAALANRHGLSDRDNAMGSITVTVRYRRVLLRLSSVDTAVKMAARVLEMAQTSVQDDFRRQCSELYFQFFDNSRGIKARHLALWVAFFTPCEFLER